MTKTSVVLVWGRIDIAAQYRAPKAAMNDKEVYMMEVCQSMGASRENRIDASLVEKR